MLKRKKGLLAGGLTSSCRITAEALARAFNSRIWPCTWRSTADGAVHADEDEEFFEASPTEDEDFEGRCRDFPVATEVRNVKLYELLQQHAVDDATDVFYDVSEHAGLSEVEGRNVREDLQEESDQIHKVQLHDFTECDELGETSNGKEEYEQSVNLTCSLECINSEESKDLSINCDTGETLKKINGAEECVNLCYSSECSKDKECKNFSANCDSGETLNWISGVEESVNLTCTPECLLNEDKKAINCDLAKVLSSIHDAEEFENLTCLPECSTNEDCTKLSISCDSGETLNIINGIEESVNSTYSSECLNNSYLEDHSVNYDSRETDKNKTIANETIHLNYLSGCLSNESNNSIEGCSRMGNINPKEISSSINVSECVNLTCPSKLFTCDPYTDLTNNSNSDELASFINSSENPLNTICSSEILNKNSPTEHLSTSVPPTMKGSSEDNEIAVMDFSGVDTSPFDNEEVLTVVIDSNSFDIHQIAVNHVEDAPSSSVQKLDFNELDHSLVNSECLSHNNDQETSVPFKEPVDSISIKITEESNNPACESDCAKRIRHSPVESTGSDDNCRLKVFDEYRPMISRSTSLKTGKTPPGTPSRKKIVRFADVLGLDLEDVRHIISGDLPNIPSSAYNDLILKDDPFRPSVPLSVTVELSCRRQASWESVPGTAGPNALYPLFAIPGQQPDFMDRVRSSGICLENVIIADCNVQCTCRVMNWSFNKKVVARYTTNGWSSSSDINASYVTDSTRDGMDSFAFNIFLTPQNNDVQLALMYEVNGKEYWDNNGGKNYCFSYHRNGSIQNAVPTSPTWMDHFW